ncbi:MAG: hypothetical protein WAK13_14640 [Terriglobales bacterium]
MTRFPITLLLISLTIPACSQSVRDLVKPAHDVAVSSTIRTSLSQAAEVEAFTRLPDQDAVIVYDTVRSTPGTTDFMDNRPHIAILSDGNVKLDLDVLSLVRGGPAIFKGMAILQGQERNAVAAFAFSLAVDGSDTFFVFVGRGPSDYRVTGTLHGLQAQLHFGQKAELELWSAKGQGTCVWCLKPYSVTKLGWSDAKLHELAPATDAGAYRPENLADEPFVVRK